MNRPQTNSPILKAHGEAGAGESRAVAYLIQDVGLQLTHSRAVQLHIYHSIRGLQKAGHRACLVALQGRRVLVTEDLNVIHGSDPLATQFGHAGLADTTSFRLLESGVRRVQAELGLPYLALFDSFRFFSGCWRNTRRYDVLHERYNLFSVGGAIASLRMGIPLVLEVNGDAIAELEFMGSPLRGVQRLYGRWTMQLSLRVARRVLSVSSQLKDHLISKWRVPAEKITVLPNGADLEAFSQPVDRHIVRQELGVGSEPLVIFVGGFYAWHALDLMLESFALVRQQIPDAKLILVGDGGRRAAIEQAVADLALAKNVVFTGAVGHDRIPTLLATADVAVAPCTPFFHGFGGSPLKLFEYMAAGRAVVATRTGQVAEVIRSGHNGILVDPGDVSGFSEAVVDLLQDGAKRERLGHNALQQAVELHSWERYVEVLEEVYYELSGSSKRES